GDGSAGRGRRRRRSSSHRRSSTIAIVSGAKHASAACRASVEGEMKRFCASFSTSRTIPDGTTIQPSRQPVIWKYLEKLLMTNTSSPDSTADRETGRPREGGDPISSYTSPW